MNKKQEKLTNEAIQKETKQRGLFKKKRGGEVLTKEQVREIKYGRKMLRKQMKAAGIRSKKEFELTAASMGLYFDKNRWWALLLWFFHGRGLWALLGAAIALLSALMLLSKISQMRGHFTINMVGDMFDRGFVLSEDEAFTNPSAQLFSDPVEDAPCISIVDIPDDIDNYEGNHSSQNYFAYTFWLRYEAEDDVPVDYSYELAINSESLNLSEAAWIMLFVDGEMTMYAKANDGGEIEALPAVTETRIGYREAPLIAQSANPEEQYEVIAQTSNGTYYRLLPKKFESDRVITSGVETGVTNMETHKYTVVMWLEGDDPDCTNDLIGGHLGIEMNFQLLDGKNESDNRGSDGFLDRIADWWDSVWEG